MRQMAYAKDLKGEYVSIDNARNTQRLFCPICNKEVVPKQGEDKIWHFAHKAGECGKTGNVNNADLNKYIIKTTGNVIFEKDPNFFTCLRCRQTMRTSLGVKWGKEEYICKECFHLL